MPDEGVGVDPAPEKTEANGEDAVDVVVVAVADPNADWNRDDAVVFGVAPPPPPNGLFPPPPPPENILERSHLARTRPGEKLKQISSVVYEPLAAI